MIHEIKVGDRVWTIQITENKLVKRNSKIVTEELAVDRVEKLPDSIIYICTKILKHITFDNIRIQRKLNNPGSAGFFVDSSAGRERTKRVYWDKKAFDNYKAEKEAEFNGVRKSTTMSLKDLLNDLN